jgi:phosphoglycolate phosphatase
MRAKAVLFDKDGTLLDFQRTWAPWALNVVDYLAQGDAGAVKDLDLAWGLDRERQLISPGSIVVAGTVQQVAAAVQAYCTDMTVAQMVDYLNVTGAKATPAPILPLEEFLNELHDLGLRTGIATNDSEATARAQFRALKIEDCFDFIAGYDSGYGGKPAPGMCLAFAERTALSAGDVVMVGDSAHDMQAGRAAGMQTVAVLTGMTERAELAPLADIVIDDIGGLTNWLSA